MELIILAIFVLLAAKNLKKKGISLTDTIGEASGALTLEALDLLDIEPVKKIKK